MPISDYESDGYGSEGAFMNTKYNDILLNKNEGTSGNGYSAQEEKRKLHNALERKRRGNIKENFDMLFDVVPCDEQEKSRAQILHSTVRHILKMNALLVEEEKFKAKCDSDIEVLQRELTRLENLRRSGVAHPELNDSVKNIINECQCVTIPDYTNINFDEEGLDNMWHDENAIVINGGVSTSSNNQSSAKNQQDGKRKNRGKEYNENGMKMYHTSSSSANMNEMAAENNVNFGNLPTLEEDMTSYNRSLSSDINQYNNIGLPTSYNQPVVSQTTFQTSTSMLNPNSVNMLNLDSNFELPGYIANTNGTPIATMVTLPSMVPINTSTASAYPAMPSLTAASNSTRPVPSHTTTANNSSQIAGSDHMNYLNGGNKY